MSYLWILIALASFFHLFYFYALWKKDFSVIDIAWGLSASIIALLAILQVEIIDWRSFLVAFLTLIWGARLAFYLCERNAKVGEDERYAQWREEWGQKANLQAYFRVFWLQTILSFVIFSSLPLIIFAQHQQFHWIDVIALLIWLLGFFIETLADSQKRKFKEQESQRGQICKKGLWRYSRHPNYFGEATLWWGIYLFSLSTDAWMYAWIGPLILNFFLLKVSGVAMLEEKKKDDLEFQKYQKETSRFIPWFVKSQKDS